MVQVHPQYITDTAGKKLVVLSIEEFNSLLEELEDVEDIRLYDQAKREDNGERFPLNDYLTLRKANPNG